MSEHRYFEHYTTDEPARLERWYCCDCCGYPTVAESYQSCEICDWYETPWGDGGSGPEDLAEARENFLAHLTKYRPGTNAFKYHDLESERVVKRQLMQA